MSRWLRGCCCARSGIQAQEPKWLTDARAREGKIGTPKEFKSKDNWFKARVPGKVKGAVEKVEDSYSIEIDFGGESAALLRVDPGRHRHGRHDAADAGTDHATGRRESGQARIPRARIRRRRRHWKSALPQGALDISRSRWQGTAARAVQAVRHAEAWPRPVLRTSRHRLREELRRRHTLARGDPRDVQRRPAALLPGNCGCDVGRREVRHCHADAREGRRRRHQGRGNHRHDGARGRRRAAHPGCGSQGMDPAGRDA